MKSLIVGGAGFVGPYLAEHLKSLGNEVCVTKIPGEEFAMQGIEVFDLDILARNDIETLLEKVQPDYVFHLAALSSVALSWKNPALTVDINVKGAANLLEAFRVYSESFEKRSGKSPRLLMIGSAEEYGAPFEGESLINEEHAVRPGNIYAATKACQNMLGAIYAKAYNLDVMMVRAFNHIGPRQLPNFVVSDFCSQVAEIEKGKKEPVIYVGNLSAKRDFSDVRDVVRAYAAIMEKGAAGETYNVGSGKAISIQEILDTILGFSTVKIEVKVDSEKFRPVDIPEIQADVTKLAAATGWKAMYSLDATLKETLDWWRNKGDIGK